MEVQNVQILQYTTTESFSNLVSLTIICTTSTIIITSSTSFGTGISLTTGQSLTLQSSDGFNLPTITITIVGGGVYGIITNN
ncbi:MAG: hypothetical protein NTY55_11155 [Flavobacteriia bacterium]|jgi:hypothetical protein|nr:hypothetical protein [Flavobacteriia bacterium]